MGKQVWRMVLLGALAAGLSGAAAAQDEAERTALALSPFARDMADAAVHDGRPPATQVEFVDLNGDGRAEAIIVFHSAFMGGARGCSTHVVDLGAAPPRPLGGMLTCGVRPAASRTGPWLDLTGPEGGLWAYGDGAYRFVRR